MIAYDLIGQTPLVLLESFSDENVKIYAKLEQFNPSGAKMIHFTLCRLEAIASGVGIRNTIWIFIYESIRN